MSHYKDISFSYFPANIKITKPLGEVTLWQMLEGIKKPKPEMVELFKKIEKASSEGDLRLKAELKSHLYYFLVCVKTDGLGRSYKNVKSFSHLGILDFDNLEPEHAKAFQKYLFETYPYIISTFLSASKKGVKAVVNFPLVNSVEEFKTVFYGLAAEMEQYAGFDGSPQNPCLPFYLCYSPELLYRDNATVFSERGYKLNEMKPYEGDFEPIENVSEEDREHIKNILKRSMEKITDSGHFIVRSASLLAGGFTGAGYFTLDEMGEFMHELIDEIPYLSKGVSGYKKTCNDMLVIGVNSPLWLDKHKNNE